MRRRFLAIGIVLFALPMPAFAAVQITEIMYDASGSDSGREWVEFTNSGSASVDASGFKFFEANTNHALTLLQGSGVLLPGGSALIVEDQAKFLADYPSYTGILFKSSFSLGNTGESIAVKDSALDILDSATYDSSMGASGDGNSLQLSGSSFVPGAPTPGSFGAGASIVNDSQNSSSTQTQTTQPQTQTSSGGPPAISAHIDADPESMVGGGEFFACSAFSATGAALSTPRCLWNFGDGTTAEGARVFHAYDYPGSYEVVLEIAYNYSSATARQAVSAVPASVSLVAEGDGSLSVLNMSDDDLDIGLWSLVEGSTTPFVIPENTLVLKDMEVRFAPSVLGFSGDMRAMLHYPNGALAASASAGKQSPLRGQAISLTKAASGYAALPAVKAAEVLAPSSSQPPAAASSSDNAAAVAETPLAMDIQWSYLLALAAVIALGAAGAYYSRIPQAAVSETDVTAEEFDIE